MAGTNPLGLISRGRGNVSGHLIVLYILNIVTKEMLFFLVRVYFLVLVRDTTLFQSDPGSLDEWTELMRSFVS